MIFPVGSGVRITGEVFGYGLRLVSRRGVVVSYENGEYRVVGLLENSMNTLWVEPASLELTDNTQEMITALQELIDDMKCRLSALEATVQEKFKDL